MAKLLDYNATLVHRHNLSEKLARFQIRPDTPGSTFHAGQYATLGLNNSDESQKGSVRRPMSIASGPKSPELLEFYVRYVDRPASDNPLTHLLFKCQVGARLFLSPKVIGKFSLEDTIGTEDHRLKLLISAGTGLAPFVSMVRARLEDKRPIDDLAIFHGVSYPNELGYREELQNLQDQGLRYLPTVSRSSHDLPWSGAQGRVEDFFKPERIENTENLLGLNIGELNAKRCVALGCGLQGTLAQSLTRLLPRGFVPHERKIKKALGFDDMRASFFWEQYDNDAVIDIKSPELITELKKSYIKY